MSTVLGDLSGARVVLVGTGMHEAGSELPSVPAVRDTVGDLRSALVTLCGVDERRIDVVLDPSTPLEVGNALVAASADQGDVLVVYYVGHGLVGAAGTLFLATAASHRYDGVEHRAFPYATVRQYLLNYLRGRPARSVVVILDCCFAGLAVGSLGDLNDLSAIAGVFVLASAGRDELALAPENQRHTAFSGALLELLHRGDAALPERITLQDAVTHLHRVLPAAGFPRPRCRAEGLAGARVLAPNRRVPYATEQVTAPSGEVGGLQPYRGLSCFEPDDAAWFFGRERLTAALVTRLRRAYDDAQPLVVSGASGAGKSSLLRAGLMPALGYGELGVHGSAHWVRCVFTPGERPFVALARQLCAVLPVDGDPAGSAADGGSRIERLAASLRVRPDALSDVLDGLRGGDVAARVLLIVDQFEEVFTTCRDGDERLAFIEALTVAAGGARPPALVVLGVRSDFYPSCQECPALITALQEHLIVGPLAVGEVRDAVERPAELAGLSVQDGLVDLLIAELDPRAAAQAPAAGAYQPGRLPLLSHALLATWHGRAGRELTIDAYRRAGGIGGALARTGEEALGRLDPTQRVLARSILIRLVHVSDGTDHIRSVAYADLVAEFDDASAVQAVLGVFSSSDARLVRVEDGFVQLTHEALIHSWSTLRSWLNEDRTGVLLAQRATEAARRWVADGEDPGQLYRGPRLAVAHDLLEGAARRHLSPLAERFLTASTAAAVAEAAADRRRLRLRRTAALVAVLLVLVTGVAVSGVLIKDRSERTQRELVAARGLMSRAAAQRNDRPAEALRSGVAAYQRAVGAADEGTINESRDGLVTSIADTRYRGSVSGDRSDVGFDVGPDDWLLRVDRHGRVILCDLRTGPEETTVPLPDAGGPVSYAAFTRGTGLLVTMVRGGALTVWSLVDRRAPRKLGSAPAGTATLTAGVSAPDGALLVTGDRDGILTVWDLRDPAHPARRFDSPRPVLGDRGAVQDIVFRDRDTLLVGTYHMITLWNLGAGGKLVREQRHELPKLPNLFPGERSQTHSLIGAHQYTATFVRISPDGRTVGVGGSYSDTASAMTAAVPDTKSTDATMLAPLVGHSLTVTGLAYDSDGDYLATTGLEGTIRLWYVGQPQRPKLVDVLSTAGREVNGLLFTPDGNTLVAGLGDGSFAMYSAEGLAPLVQTRTLKPDWHHAWVNPAPDAKQQGLLTKGHRPMVAVDVARQLAVTGTRAIENMSMELGEPATKSDKQNARWQIMQLPGRQILATQERQHSVTALATHSGRRLLAVGTGVGLVSLWDIADPRRQKLIGEWTGKQLGLMSPVVQTNVEIVRVAFSPDGERLVVGTDGAGFVVADVSNLADVHFSPVLQVAGTVRALQFSPDGSVVASGGGDGLVRFWRVTQLTRPELLPVPTQVAGRALTSIAFSQSTGLMAVGAEDGVVALWDVLRLDAALPLQELSWTGVAARSLQFDTAGAYLAATDEDRVAAHWSVRRATQVIQNPWGAACRIVDERSDPDAGNRTLCDSRS